MNVLAIDTSGAVGHVAAGPLAALVSAALPLPPDGGRPSTGGLLAPTVAHLLDAGGWPPASIELCVVGLGPGSYTGVRIGLAFVKGFALAADCPIVGVSSLEILAHNGPADAGEVLVVRDARWGEVYWARFGRTPGGWERRSPDQVGACADLVPHGAAIVGDPSRVDAAQLGVPDLGAPSHPARIPDAAAAARIGVDRYRTHGADASAVLVPHYLRPSAAERNVAGRR